MLILAVFWVSAIPAVDFNHWALNVGVGRAAERALIAVPDGDTARAEIEPMAGRYGASGASWTTFSIEVEPLEDEVPDPEHADEDEPQTLEEGDVVHQ